MSNTRPTHPIRLEIDEDTLTVEGLTKAFESACSNAGYDYYALDPDVRSDMLSEMLDAVPESRRLRFKLRYDKNNPAPVTTKYFFTEHGSLCKAGSRIDAVFNVFMTGMVSIQLELFLEDDSILAASVIHSDLFPEKMLKSKSKASFGVRTYLRSGGAPDFSGQMMFNDIANFLMTEYALCQSGKAKTLDAEGFGDDLKTAFSQKATALGVSMTNFGVKQALRYHLQNGDVDDSDLEAEDLLNSSDQVMHETFRDVMDASLSNALKIDFAAQIETLISLAGFKLESPTAPKH